MGIHGERLIELAETIEARGQPLGVGLKNQCWAGVAHEIASAKGEKVTEYFGITFKEMRADIKGNNECPTESRNKKMAKRSRELARSR